MNLWCVLVTPVSLSWLSCPWHDHHDHYDQHDQNNQHDHGSPTYSQQSKSHHGEGLTVMITVGDLSPADSHHWIFIYDESHRTHCIMWWSRWWRHTSHIIWKSLSLRQKLYGKKVKVKFFLNNQKSGKYYQPVNNLSSEWILLHLKLWTVKRHTRK